MSADYRTSHDAAMFTVETHIRFLAECSEGQTLTATTTLVDADAKRVRLHSELFADGELAATGESLYLHVDTATGRTAPLPADRQARVDAMLAAHADVPRPAHLGLGVAGATVSDPRAARHGSRFTTPYEGRGHRAWDAGRRDRGPAAAARHGRRSPSGSTTTAT